jgi:hypothetical protein
MSQNLTGQQIDYEAFKLEYDNNPQIKNLVKSFNGRGLVIKTKAKDKEEVRNKKPSGNSGALAAANAVLKRPG